MIRPGKRGPAGRIGQVGDLSSHAHQLRGVPSLGSAFRSVSSLSSGSSFTASRLCGTQQSVTGERRYELVARGPAAWPCPCIYFRPPLLCPLFRGRPAPPLARTRRMTRPAFLSSLFLLACSTAAIAQPPAQDMSTVLGVQR